MSIPVRSGMEVSNVCYVPSVRSTLCDIMCTINTHRQFDVPVSEEFSDSIVASLPYKTSRTMSSTSSAGATRFQKLKISEIKHRKVDQLKRDRELYFNKLLVERYERNLLRQSAAIKLQSLFRGYRKRTGHCSYVRKKKEVTILSQNELQDELCRMAVGLQLDPIAGLSLEARSKTSRRRNRIENAAAFRLQKFFRMLYERSMARFVVDVRRLEVIHRSAKIITKAVRYIKTKNFVKKCDIIKKNNKALKIQMRFRIFQAFMRSREKKHLKVERLRRNEAAIVIQRNCATKYRNVLSLARITMVSLRHFNLMVGEVAHLITESLVDEYLEGAVEKWGLNWDRTALPAITAVCEETIDHVLLETAERAGIMWVEEQYRAILEENQRLTEERVLLEENVEQLANAALGESSKGKTALFDVDLELFFGSDEEVDLSASVSSFVGKITSKAITRASLSMSADDQNEGASPTKVKSNLRCSVTDFVGQVANKAIKRASVCLTAPATGLPPQNQLNDSVSDFVTSLTRKSILRMSLASPQLLHGTTSAVLSNDSVLQGVAAGVADSSIATALQCVAELQNERSEDQLRQPDTARSQAFVAVVTVPKYRDLTESLAAVGMADERRDQLQARVQECHDAHYLGNFAESLRLLDSLCAAVSSGQWVDLIHCQDAQCLDFLADLQLMRATSLYALAEFADAKTLLDAVHSSRVDRIEARVCLVVEVQWHLAEWHRSQAEYNEADLYYTQAIANSERGLSLEGAFHDNEPVSADTAFLLDLQARLLIGYTELLKNRGQYYKANEHLALAQEAVRSNKARGAGSFETQVELIVCLISLFVVKGKYSNAVSLHQELLDKRRLHYGLSHPKVATSMNSLGALMLLKCEFAEASRLIEEGLAMRLQFFPDLDHPSIAASLHTRAQGYLALGHYEKAFSDSASSLEMRVRLFGATHPSVGQSLTSVAYIQSLMGLPVEALANFSSGLSIRKERFGTDLHRDVAESVFLMAINAQMRGCHAEAISYFEQAVALRQELLPLFGQDVKTHLDLELSKMFLGRAYMGACRIEEAKEIMKQAVKNVCVILGNNHILVSRCLTYLGELCKVRGNCFDAKNLLTTSFNIVNQFFGDAHPEVVQIMLQAADNFRVPGHYAEATELSMSAYRLCIDIFGEDCLFVAEAQCVHASILRDCGRHTDAEQVFLHALNTYLSKIGETSAPYAEALAALAECYRMQGKYEAAERAFQQALTVARRVSGEGGSLLEIDTLCNYAVLLLDTQNAQAAVVIIAEKVLPQYEEQLGARHMKSAYARANLALGKQALKYTNGQDTDGASEMGTTLLQGDLDDFIRLCGLSGYTADHPWVLRLTSSSESRSVTAASQSASQSVSQSASQTISQSASRAVSSYALDGSLEGPSVVTGDASLETSFQAGDSLENSLVESSFVENSRGDSTFIGSEDERDLYSSSLVSHPTLETRRTGDTDSRPPYSVSRDGDTYSSRSPSGHSASLSHQYTNASMFSSASRLHNLEGSTIDGSWAQGYDEDGGQSASLDIFSKSMGSIDDEQSHHSFDSVQ